MTSFPVLQEIEGGWRAEKTVEIMGLRILAYFTTDPQSLHDYISNFQTKSGDVFIASYPKSGTTWVQEIVYQIYNNGTINSKRIEDRIPFLEEATNPKSSQPNINTLPSPRIIKTHLSYEAIPKGTVKNSTCKYIYIARNPKDVAVSKLRFFTSLAKDTGFNAPWEFYVKLFAHGKTTYNHWNEHVLGWWKHRHDSNVLFLKYEDLQKDLRSHVRMIADFLGKPLSDELINRIAEQCTFQGMTKNWACYTFSEKESGEGLLRKGVVADWKNHFTPEQNEGFENEVLQKLSGRGLVFDLEI